MPRFTYHCPLRWSDLDAFGHVNNARILTLYEEARVAMMFAAARRAGLDSFEAGVVIHRHEVDYLRPVDFDSTRAPAGLPVTVHIDLWVEEIRPSRVTVAYEMLDGPTVAGRARSVLVPYDLVNGRPRRLSPDERAFLEPYLDKPATP